MIRSIKIHYHNPNMTKLEKIHGDKSDWIDLRAAQDYTIQKGDFVMISLGVSMELPEGYEAHVVPRSSTFNKYGLIQTNSCGIIDHSYCGTNDIWHFPAYATRDTRINENERICQFRIVECQPKIVFVEEEELNSVNRGGFGSTGRE